MGQYIFIIGRQKKLQTSLYFHSRMKSGESEVCGASIVIFKRIVFSLSYGRLVELLLLFKIVPQLILALGRSLNCW